MIVLASAFARELPPVAIGENILNQSGLAADADGMPIDWNYHFEDEGGGLRIIESNGVRFARLSPRKDPGECKLAQVDIHLVPGAKYRVGALVRTANVEANALGIVVTSWAWIKSEGPTVPRDTKGEWVKVEKEFVAPESRLEIYRFFAYTVNQKKGTMDVREPYLVAVDAAGTNGVERSWRMSDYRRITPVGPLLEDIPAGDCDFPFAFFSKGKELSCSVYTKMEGEAERLQGKFPVAGNRVAAKLRGMRAGAKGTIRAEVRRGNAVVAKSSYPIAVREDISLSHPVERRLNNMVSRLLTAEAKDVVFEFSAPQDTWVWIRLEKYDQFTFKTKVWLDDAAEPAGIARPGEPFFETMQWVRRGDHRIKVKDSVGGKMTVNAVPQLFCYSYPGRIKYLDTYMPYQGSFLTNYLFRSFNIFSYGYGAGVTKAEWDDLYARGKRTLAHGLVWSKRDVGFTGRYEDADHLAERLRFAASSKCERHTGVTYDEVFMFEYKPKWIYADAMRKLQDAENACCTWSSGYHFPYTALDAEYLSACVNSAHGQGRFFFETYPQYKTADVKEAEAYLSDVIDETTRRAKRLMPGFARNSFFVMGLYTGIGKLLCYDKDCESDPKWLQDRFIQKLVTTKDLDGLAGFGLYCYNNAEEEDTRWVCDAVRHYLLEGRTDSFARIHSITLDPAIVRNGTFAKGLEGWTAEGAIRADSVKGYAKAVQARRHCTTCGDEVAVFRRDAAQPNVLSQKIDNLVPGRLYSLRYAVSPMSEIVKDGKEGPVRRYVLSARVEGALDVTAAMPVAEHGGAERNTPKLNARTIVFRAQSTSARLVFSDWLSDREPGGTAGEELALSVVRVRPYYAGPVTLEVIEADGNGPTPADSILAVRDKLRRIRLAKPESRIMIVAKDPGDPVVNRELMKFTDGKTVYWHGPAVEEIGASNADVRAARPQTRFGAVNFGLDSWWLNRLKDKRTQIRSADGKIDLVLFGDSITHNWENEGRESLDELRKSWNVLDIGYGGDRTDNLLWRGLHGELDGYAAKCVMLMVGVNNISCGDSPEDTAVGIRRLLQLIARKQPHATILLLPVFPSGKDATDKNRVGTEKVNGIIRSFADGKKIVWVDFNAKWLDANGDVKWIMADRVHPTAEGYRTIWLPAVKPLIARICGGGSGLPPLYGDGVNDDTAAIQARLDRGSPCVNLPPPKDHYLISRSLELHSGQELRLDASTRVRMAPYADRPMLVNRNWETGNRGISVVGGIWDYDNLNQSPNPIAQDSSRHPKAFDRSFHLGCIFRFDRVDGLTVRGVTFRNPTTYSCQLTRVSNFTVKDIVFDFRTWNPIPLNMDGIHLDGGCNHGRIANLRGTCFDDMVALNANDGFCSAFEGEISDIEIDGLHSDFTHRGVRILSTGAPVRRVRIRNLDIKTYRNALAITHFFPERPARGVFGDISICDSSASAAPEPKELRRKSPSAAPMIWVQAGCDVSRLEIRNFSRTETCCANAPTISIDKGARIDTLVVRDCRQENKVDGKMTFLDKRGDVRVFESSGNPAD